MTWGARILHFISFHFNAVSLKVPGTVRVGSGVNSSRWGGPSSQEHASYEGAVAGTPALPLGGQGDFPITHIYRQGPNRVGSN